MMVRDIYYNQKQEFAVFGIEISALCTEQTYVEDTIPREIQKEAESEKSGEIYRENSVV